MLWYGIYGHDIASLAEADSSIEAAVELYSASEGPVSFVEPELLTGPLFSSFAYRWFVFVHFRDDPSKRLPLYVYRGNPLDFRADLL